MEQPTASRSTIFAWTLFDFANTGFYVVIITLVFPTFFTSVIAGGEAVYWGRTISTSMLITALIGPLLGSIADATNRKKRFLALFTVACVVATAGLYVTGPGTLWAAVLLLIVANIGFEGGTIFYDAFLPELSSEKDYSKISGYGFAMGYLGSFVVLLIVLPILSPADATQSDIKLTFLIAAAFFAIFSLPLFFKVKEHERTPKNENELILIGYRRLRETFAHLRRYDAIKRFLIAFFVYNDSILTVIVFASIYGHDTLHLSTESLVFFFMIVQSTALVGSLIFGAITNAIGARQSILITLGIWIGVVVAAYFIDSLAGALGIGVKETFFAIGGAAGIALGSSQSASRTMMALLTPFEKRTEFFGFYDGFFGKASATIGPLIFGEVADIWGQRPAMLVLGGLFTIGIVLMMRVPDVRPEQEVPQVAEAVGAA